MYAVKGSKLPTRLCQARPVEMTRLGFFVFANLDNASLSLAHLFEHPPMINFLKRTKKPNPILSDDPSQAS